MKKSVLVTTLKSMVQRLSVQSHRCTTVVIIFILWTCFWFFQAFLYWTLKNPVSVSLTNEFNLFTYIYIWLIKIFLPRVVLQLFEHFKSFWKMKIFFLPTENKFRSLKLWIVVWLTSKYEKIIFYWFFTHWLPFNKSPYFLPWHALKNRLIDVCLSNFAYLF